MSSYLRIMSQRKMSRSVQKSSIQSRASARTAFYKVILRYGILIAYLAALLPVYFLPRIDSPGVVLHFAASLFHIHHTVLVMKQARMIRYWPAGWLKRCESLITGKSCRYRGRTSNWRHLHHEAPPDGVERVRNHVSRGSRCLHHRYDRNISFLVRSLKFRAKTLRNADNDSLLPRSTCMISHAICMFEALHQTGLFRASMLQAGATQSKRLQHAIQRHSELMETLRQVRQYWNTI